MVQRRDRENGNGAPSFDGDNGEWFFKGDEYNEKDSIRQLYRKILSVLHKVGSYFGQVGAIVKEFAAFKADFSKNFNGLANAFLQLKQSNTAFQENITRQMAALNENVAACRGKIDSNIAAVNELSKWIESQTKGFELYKGTVDLYKTTVDNFIKDAKTKGLPVQYGNIPEPWLAAINTKLAPTENEQTKIIKAIAQQNLKLQQRLQTITIILIVAVAITALSGCGVAYILYNKPFAAPAAVEPQPEPSQAEQQSQPQPAAASAPAQAEAPKKPVKPVPMWLRKKANKD
jgi:hypothetical protein